MFHFQILFRVLNLEGASRRLYLDQSNALFYVQKSLSYFVAVKYCTDKNVTAIILVCNPLLNASIQ